MPTVFPVEVEVFKENWEKASPRLLQAFTCNVSEGGMCLELKSFGQKTEEVLNQPGIHLGLLINPPFAKDPIKAFSRVVWIKKEEGTFPVKFLIGVAYTEIEPRSRARLIAYARRLLWTPRLLTGIGVILITAFIGLFVHDYQLIEQNKKLVRQVAKSAQQRSEVSQHLLDVHKRREDLKTVLTKADQKVRELEDTLAHLTSESDAQRQAYESELKSRQAEQKKLDDELAALQSNAKALTRDYDDLKERDTQRENAVLNDMHQWIVSHQNHKTGLVQSFEGDDKLSDMAFTYDQALAAQTFLLFSDLERAAQTLNFFKDRARRDPTGGFFNAYNAHDGEPQENISHVGPNIWIGIAALQYDARSRDGRFLPMAKSIAEWTLKFQDEEGGIRGGKDVSWYSTEHNLDAYAFFNMLYQKTGQTEYKWSRDKILSWIKKYAFSLNERRPNRGKGDSTISTDTFSWAVAALGPQTLFDMGFDPEEIMAFAEEHCSVKVPFRAATGAKITVSGFDFAKAQNMGRGGVISTEWTAQMIVAYQKMAEYFKDKDSDKSRVYDSKARFYMNELQKMLITSPSRTGQGRGCLPYASHDNVDTGHGWRTPNGNSTGSLSGTAYGIFAWKEYNPFEFS